MAEFKPIRNKNGKYAEFAAADTIPAVNVPAINLAGTGPGGITGDLPLDNIAQGGATDGQSLLWNNVGGTWEPGTPAGGGDVSDGDTLSTGLTFPNTGLHLLDTNASHDLILSPGSDLTADRTLTLTTGDANRTLTLSADATISGTNSGNVTLSGSLDYLTLAAQVITVGAIDLATDTTGLLNAANVGAGSVDNTEFGYLNGVTSAIQTQINAKATEGALVLTAAPGADHTAYGVKITLTASENQAFGDVCYIASDGEATIADADALATADGLFMCLETVTTGSSASYLMFGIARDDTWTWTVGGLIYLSTTGTTGNTMTQTAPSGAADIVQILGKATHADRMYFRPELVTIELA